MGISMKKYTICWFYADQIDVIMNFAVITTVVMKRVHCNQLWFHILFLLQSNAVFRVSNLRGVSRYQLTSLYGSDRTSKSFQQTTYYRQKSCFQFSQFLLR